MKHKPGYRIHEYEDETSSCDPEAYWVHNGEYYARKYRVWIPIALKYKNINDWLFEHEDEIEYIE